MGDHDLQQLVCPAIWFGLQIKGLNSFFEDGPSLHFHWHLPLCSDGKTTELESQGGGGGGTNGGGDDGKRGGEKEESDWWRRFQVGIF